MKRKKKEKSYKDWIFDNMGYVLGILVIMNMCTGGSDDEEPGTFEEVYEEALAEVEELDTSENLTWYVEPPMNYSADPFELLPEPDQTEEDTDILSDGDLLKT